MISVRASIIAITFSYLVYSQPASSAEFSGKADRWRESLGERISWWNEARFGMFIHWGLYAIPAGEWQGKRVGGIGEWIMHNGHIKPSEYRPLAQRFNPTKFNAEEWVKLMKQAGCRYFVITTKHHDGFALFRSEVSDYDIANTPFGRGNDRDIMRELADAARKHGVRIGWYHSIMDWQHPDYLPRKKWDDRPSGNADFDRYQEYLHVQVKEILNNYGDIDVIWFDGEWEGSWTHERGIALHEHCMQQNPNLLVNNRVDKGRKGMQGMSKDVKFRGDFGTPEQEIPETGFGDGVYWESCMTMNNTWGYKSYDHNWKSARVLIRNLIDTASKGGNYLLNVGPTALGEIPEPSQVRLREMGKWLENNGESIYGTHAGCFEKLAWGRTTQRRLSNGDTALYLHVFDWPEDGELLVPGLVNQVVGVDSIESKRQSQISAYRKTPEGILIKLAGQAWDKHASVIKLVLKGTPRIDERAYELSMRIKPENGVLSLDAARARIIGDGARVEHTHGKANIGYWTNSKTEIEFATLVEQTGKYSVQLEYALPSDHKDNKVKLDFGDQGSLVHTLKPTGSWKEFRSGTVGHLELNKSDLMKVRVIPTSIPNDTVMNLRRVVLTPID